MVIAVPALVIGVFLAALLIWGPRHTTEQVSTEVWTCSMHPQVRLPQRGNCPICGMSLIPLSQLTSEHVQTEQRAGLETEPVTLRELFKEIHTVGKLDFNEARIAYITARIDGRIDRVFADFTGIQVKKKDHLVEIYSPELYASQSELFRALEVAEKSPNDRFATSNLESARTKLRLLGILPEQVQEIERSRREATHLTIYAPIGGVVIEKNVREQQYINKGDMLYRIAELDPIWLYLDIYESDLAWVRFGQSVEVTVEAYPGDTFRGTVAFIDPYLNDATRTVKVRVNLKNVDNKLKPAMYASATIRVQLRRDGTPQPTGLEGKYVCPMHPEIVRDEPGTCPICEMKLERVPDLFPSKDVGTKVSAPGTEQPDDNKVLAIRKSAVLDTGRRQVTYRKRKDGAYELVELKLGPLATGTDDAGQGVLYNPVFAGLQRGDEVVVQGGYLLDSQRQIEGMPSLLYVEGQSAAALHAGHSGHSMPKSAPAAPTTGHQH